MSAPSKYTRPETLAPGTVSCMRLRQRRKLDLPQPDGPMMAVIDRSWNVTDTLLTPTMSPNRASRPSTRMCGMTPWSVPAASPGTCSVTGAVARSGDDSRDEADDEDEAEEDEGARPGLRVPIVVRANGIIEDLEWKCGNRLLDRRRPEVVS